MRYILRLLAAVAFCFASAALVGAAVTNTPVFPQTPKYSQTCFIQGTDTAGTYKTIYTGGTNGSKIVGILAGTNDDVSHLLTVRPSTSTSDHCATNGTCGSGAAVTLAASSGYAALTPVVDVKNATNWPGLPVDSDNNPFVYLSGNTQTVEATFATAFSTAGEHVCVSVVGVDF